MWTFQYKHGDRPLEGYTIQRAAGRGGFGEVYYAVSDSGREVALKVIQGYEQIELRGISQCMNLKSPHLVTIFDVRQNAEGRWFVIMEFVSGANLRQLLDESPSGLGTQKSAFFLREIAKGLTFLHECGIVHRDLKPANIFYENGYVKIGDYGLSKAITPDQRSGQTVTVGTVHYMAPEIGAGKYDRSVDIYALGALLYEMLTGTVPHIGASPTEVLMKHLSAEPDCSNVPEPFCHVIKKAMAKDPSQRYQSVQEMVEDVFGAEHIRQSVSVFSPADLSMIAEHAAKRVAVGAGVGGSGGSGGGGVGVATGSSAATREAPGAKPFRFGEVFDRVFESAPPPSGAPASAPASSEPLTHDPLNVSQRRLLAMMISLAAALIAGSVGGYQIPVGSAVFFVLPAIWGIALGIGVAHRKLLPSMMQESALVKRFVIGLVAGGFALIGTLPLLLSLRASHFYVGPHQPRTFAELYLATLLAALVAILVLPIERILQPERRQRINVGICVGAGAIAFVCCGMFQADGSTGIAIAVASLVVVQMLVPWIPTAASAQESPGRRWRSRFAVPPVPPRVAVPPVPPIAPMPTPQQWNRWGEALGKAASNFGTAAGKVGTEIGTAFQPGAPASPTSRARSNAYWWKPVPAFLRFVWLIVVLIGFAASVAMLIGASSVSDADMPPFLFFGLLLGQIGVFAIVRANTHRFVGWWGYLIRPILIFALCAACVSVLTYIGNVHLNDSELAIAWFWAIILGGGGIVLMCLPGKYRLATAPPPIPPASQPSTDSVGPPAASESALPRTERAGASMFLSLIAGLSLLAMLVAGLVYAAHVPVLMNSAVLDPSMPTHLERDVFGTHDWPPLVDSMIFGLVIALMFLTMTVAGLARRRSSAAHVLRAIFAPLLFLLAILALHASLREDVYNQLQQSQPLLPGKALLIFYDHLKVGLILLGAALVVLGLIVFCWSPSDAQRAVQSAPARSPASRAVRIFLSLAFAALLLLFLGALVVGVSFHQSVETKIGTPAPGFQYQLNAPSGGAGRGEIFVTPGAVRVRAAPVLPKQPIAKPPVVQPLVAPAPSTEPAQPDEPDGVFNQ